MTDTTRPEWMPSSFEILLALRDLEIDSPSGVVIAPRLTALHRRTGLRAQIAVLEEMPLAVIEVDGAYHHNAEHTAWVRRKISALRKELEG